MINRTILSQSVIGDRTSNQDASVFLQGRSFLLCVADGLGGHESGEIAAQALCENVNTSFSALIDSSDLDEATFRKTVELVLEKTQKQLSNPDNPVNSHTTMALSWVDDCKVLTAHVGDSRVLKISQQEGVIWRTRDHSVLQMLVDIGEVAEEDMGTHPEQGRLIKSIGPLKPAIATFKKLPALKNREKLVVCSDGFWEYMSQDNYKELAANTELSYLKELIERIHQKASPSSDNITVQLLF